jgi:regulator of sirC expression with transglutaminase-like and TPR domain
MAITSETNFTLESTNSFDALVAINRALGVDDSQDTCSRIVKFMTYELATLCDNDSHEQIFLKLNEYFFKTKNFKLSTEPVLLKNVLEERRGCGIVLALLYVHFAQSLGLKLQLIHWPLHTTLKCELENKSCFIDLEQNGKILCEDEILLLIARIKPHRITCAIFGLYGDSLPTSFQWRLPTQSIIFDFTI